VKAVGVLYYYQGGTITKEGCASFSPSLCHRYRQAGDYPPPMTIDGY